MIPCTYEIPHAHGEGAACGRPALAITVTGPNGGLDWELCPDHFALIVGDPTWRQQVQRLLREDEE